MWVCLGTGVCVEGVALLSGGTLHQLFLQSTEHAESGPTSQMHV